VKIFQRFNPTQIRIRMDKSLVNPVVAELYGNGFFANITGYNSTIDFGYQQMESICAQINDGYMLHIVCQLHSIFVIN
jgi:hypothetical protein